MRQNHPAHTSWVPCSDECPPDNLTVVARNSDGTTWMTKGRFVHSVLEWTTIDSLLARPKARRPLPEPWTDAPLPLDEDNRLTCIVRVTVKGIEGSIWWPKGLPISEPSRVKAWHALPDVPPDECFEEES